MMGNEARNPAHAVNIELFKTKKPPTFGEA